MAMPRWLKWTVRGLAAMFMVFVLMVGAGVWYLSSVMTPDVAVGEPLPQAMLTRLDGVPIDLEEFRGRVVVLDFWSSW